MKLTKTVFVIHGIDEHKTVRVVLLHNSAGLHRHLGGVVHVDLLQPQLGQNIVNINCEQSEIIHNEMILRVNMKIIFVRSFCFANASGQIEGE